MIDQPNEIESHRNDHQNDLTDGEAEILWKGDILRIGDLLQTGIDSDGRRKC